MPSRSRVPDQRTDPQDHPAGDHTSRGPGRSSASCLEDHGLVVDQVLADGHGAPLGWRCERSVPDPLRRFPSAWSGGARRGPTRYPCQWAGRVSAGDRSVRRRRSRPRAGTGPGRAAAQVGPGQVRAAEVRPGQVRQPQVGPAEVGPDEERPAEVGAPQVLAAEVRRRQGRRLGGRRARRRAARLRPRPVPARWPSPAGRRSPRGRPPRPRQAGHRPATCVSASTPSSAARSSRCTGRAAASASASARYQASSWSCRMTAKTSNMRSAAPGDSRQSAPANVTWVRCWPAPKQS